MTGETEILDVEAWRTFVSDLARVAASPATVLLEGEPGSGKTRAARTLHRSSPRAAGPLVLVDLASLAPSLIESELFGHEEGAFTGAHRSRQGRFRRADGGTLVLEGVERLTGELQGKLLRVLQERAVEPLGADVPQAIDVRLVATSTADLAGEVRERRFREDLYWRLAVVRLRVPPLRARVGDLRRLVDEISSAVAERVGVHLRPMSPDALARLTRHPWPGNVRELENVLERVTVLAHCHDGELPAPLEPNPVEENELDFLDEAVTGVADRVASEALAHGLSLDEVDLALMEAALAERRGNVSAAARAVGLTRRAFEYRLDKLRGTDPGPDETPNADSGEAAR